MNSKIINHLYSHYTKHKYNSSDLLLDRYPFDNIQYSNSEFINISSNTSFYKGVHYYFTKKQEKKLTENIKGFWVTNNPYRAIYYSSLFNGGIQAYTTNKNIKVLNIHNETVIQKLFEKDNMLIKTMFGYNITIDEQKKLVKQFADKHDKKFYFFNNKNDRFYKKQKLNDKLIELVNKIYKNDIDGIFYKNIHSKFIGDVEEEIYIYNNNSLLRDTNNILDWTNLKNKPQIINVDIFLPSKKMMINKKYSHYLEKWYFRNFTKYTVPTSNISYLLYNINEFKSINQYDTIESSIKNISDFIFKNNIKQILFTNTNNNINTSIKNKLGNYTSITFGNNLLLIKGKIDKSYYKIDKIKYTDMYGKNGYIEYCHNNENNVIYCSLINDNSLFKNNEVIKNPTFEKEYKNLDKIRKTIMKYIIQNISPKIIIGSLYIRKFDKAFDLLNSYHGLHTDITNIYGWKNDYIISKNPLKYNNIIDFKYSINYPILAY